MTTPPPDEDREEEGGARGAPVAPVVCVSSESFLEKRGRNGEWGVGRLQQQWCGIPVARACLSAYVVGMLFVEV